MFPVIFVAGAARQHVRRGEQIVSLYALAVGIAIAIYVVVRFRKTKLEKRKWVYPLLLSTFPIYYWVFAVYGSDYSFVAL